jgi:hypothetical protein
VIDRPSTKGKSWLLKAYYHRIELLSLVFSFILVITFYILAKEGVETRRQSDVIAAQGAQQKKILEDQIRFNKFLIDNNGQTIGELRQQIVDQANRDRAELRRLEDALRTAGVKLPAQSVLEGSTGASISSVSTPTTSPSGTVVTNPQPPPSTASRASSHHFPNICLIGICLFGDI